ncbi:vWA domain-containing protein [Nocardiopsis algeriensis]|uniref:vWA domain-containing protein n=1 Tax=Nocardiopsis algeriensis TaxID=1478215 RepID=UPI003B43AC9A
MTPTPSAASGWRRAALTAVSLFLLPSLAAPAAASGPRPAETPETAPLDIVVLVDESGSLSESDMEEEAKAASTIAQSVLEPGSRVTVVGFGSNNGESGQVAAREVCSPTLTDSEEGRQYLSDCTLDLALRSPEEGDDTDHAEALSRALEYLSDDSSPENAAKVVFLLTDGGLDVGNSPQYGAPERRNENAAALVEEHLATAREEGVQIWPLGFGSAIDRGQLDDFAAGGSQEGCSTLDVAAPAARVVEDSSDVLLSLQEAMASATCSMAGEPGIDTLTGGESTTLDVEIPLIATDGAIQVVKNNPAIGVEYIDPEGDTVDTGAGEHKQSETSLSGANGPVEVLRVVDPVPGTWQVRLTSPEGAADELVTARVQWKGIINTHVAVETTENPGELAAVVFIRTRRGAVTSAEALADLDFSAAASFPDGSTEDIPLRDDGAEPDRQGGDGQYSGTVVLPEDADTVTVTSRVQGPGISDDVNEYVYTADAGAGLLRPDIAFQDTPAEVWGGSEIRGTLTVGNTGTGNEHVELALSLPEGMLATLEQESSSFAPGSSQSPFTIRISGDSALGTGTLNVQALDASGQLLTTSSPVTLTVRTEPGIAERYWWAWTALLAALALVGAYSCVRWSAYRTSRNVRGLVVRLHDGGRPLEPPLRAPGRQKFEFSFTVRDPEGTLPRLEQVSVPGTASAYRVTRTGGGVRLHTPRGSVQILRFGEHSTPLTGRLTVSFSDDRRPRPSRSPVPPQAPGGRGSPVPGPRTGGATSGIPLD